MPILLHSIENPKLKCETLLWPRSRNGLIFVFLLIPLGVSGTEMPKTLPLQVKAIAKEILPSQGGSNCLLVQRRIAIACNCQNAFPRNIIAFSTCLDYDHC